MNHETFSPISFPQSAQFFRKCRSHVRSLPPHWNREEGCRGRERASIGSEFLNVKHHALLRQECWPPMESSTIPGATSILPYSNIATIYIEIYIVFYDRPCLRSQIRDSHADFVTTWPLTPYHFDSSLNTPKFTFRIAKHGLSHCETCLTSPRNMPNRGSKDGQSQLERCLTANWEVGFRSPIS